MSLIRDDDDPILVLWVVLLIAATLAIMAVLKFFRGY